LGRSDGEFDDDERLLVSGERGVLEIRAMRLRNGDAPSVDWFRRLEKRGIGQLIATASIIETNFLTHRAPAGRTEMIPGSRNNLMEVRVTPKGGTPPHLRLFVVRRGMRLFAATGITKTSDELKSKDIEEAERFCDRWRAEGEKD